MQEDIKSPHPNPCLKRPSKGRGGNVVVVVVVHTKRTTKQKQAVFDFHDFFGKVHMPGQMDYKF